MTHATPRPWKVNTEYDCGENRVYRIEGANGERIVETDCGYYPPTMADAALIVRAVNSYDALMEACELALYKLEDMEERFGSKWPLDLSPERAETKLRAALATARG